MNSDQINNIFANIQSLLSGGKVNQSLQELQLFTDELQMGEYTDKLNDLKQNYKYLLYYFSNGINDPERITVYNKLISKIFTLTAQLKEELLVRNSVGFEYTQKRYFPHRRRFSKISPLVDAVNYYYQQTETLKAEANDSESEKKHLRNNYESLLPELFSIYWLTSFYNQEEKDTFSNLITEDKWSFVEKALLVSALTMNLWRMFDESKLMMLFDCCNSKQQHVKQRAIVGICFILARYDLFIPYFPSIRNRLVILADENQTFENFKNIFIQIISTTDTDKITRKMEEEILPEVMKISPLIKDKIDHDNLFKSDEFDEENPEWQEILEQSGVADKLKELSELQMEGADVYMSTFSMLKSFSFFNDITNWFMPFDPQHTAVSELFTTSDANLLSAFIANNLMCNSDKYSFCLSILQMPEVQRNGIKQSFKAESEQLQEIAKDEAILKPEMVAKNISKHYIQDLFRFFRLNSQSKNFQDMFMTSLELHQSHIFDLLSSGTDLKANIAEYLFTKSHYKEATELFQEMLEEDPASVAVLQKAGYAYQKTGLIELALQAYIKADIIQPDDLWTVKKIAICYRIQGNYPKAMEFYRHADFLKPNQKSIQMNIAGCLVNMDKHAEALDIYLKLNNQDEDLNVLKSIVHCSFISNNLAGAKYYSDRILELEPDETDFLYAGHIAFCTEKITDAIELYKKSLVLLDNNDIIFEDNFRKSLSYLISYGIDFNDISLILDAIQLK